MSPENVDNQWMQEGSLTLPVLIFSSPHSQLGHSQPLLCCVWSRLEATYGPDLLCFNYL